MSPATGPAPASDGMSLSPVIKVNGSEIAAVFTNALSELRVRTAVRTIGRCTLRFEDHEHELVTRATLKIGVGLEVLAKGVDRGSTQDPLFNGTITSVSVEQRAGRTAELVVVAEDGAWQLSRGTKARTFLKVRYSDAVTQVLQGASLTAKVTGTTEQYEYLLQTDTDLGFIDELARRSGFDWVVTADKSFHFWPSWTTGGRTGSLGETVTLTAGRTLDEFSVKVTGDSPKKVTVRGWDRAKKQTVEGTADATVSLPERLKGAAGLRALTDGDVLDSRSAPSSQSDAQTLAEAVVRDGGVVVARGRTEINPGLTPGGTVDLQGIGPASGSYFVHEVEHVYRRGGFASSFVAGDRHVPGLVDVDGSNGPTRSSFFQQGLVPAIVTNVKDPDKHGRVKVKFAILNDTIESDWARITTIGGGLSRGMSFMPEVNDEVLVAFEGGDVRHPVVLGGLFNGEDKALADLVGDSGSVDARRITSRLGHVVELGDGAGPDKRHVLLALGNDGGDPTHRLRLGKDKVDLAVPGGVPLKIAVGSSSIEMDGKGAITLTGTTITLKAEQSVTIDSAKVTVKGQQNVGIDGGAVEIKAGATAKIEASGVTTIKGGMVQIN